MLSGRFGRLQRGPRDHECRDPDCRADDREAVYPGDEGACVGGVACQCAVDGDAESAGGLAGGVLTLLAKPARSAGAACMAADTTAAVRKPIPRPNPMNVGSSVE